MKLTHARLDRLLAIVLIAGAAALRLQHILGHFDVDWEPDSYQHLLIAKSALAHSTAGFWMVIDPWAKPLFTLLATLIWAAIPRHWPLIPIVQLANSVLWMISVGLVASVANREARQVHAGLIVLALGLFSFVAFRESVSTLTEPSGAILIAAGLSAKARNRPTLSAFSFGLAGLARLDALLLALVAVLSGCVEIARRPKNTVRDKLSRMFLLAVAAAAPVVCWESLGLLHGGPIHYILGSYAGAGSPYGHGDLLYYIRAFRQADPFLVFAGLAAGLLALLPRSGLPSATRLAALQALAYFVVLSLMWSQGAMGLAGLLRYFVVVYPAFLLAGGWLLGHLLLRLRFEWAGALGALALVLAVQAFELRRIYRPPVYEENEITSLLPSEFGSYPYRQLSSLREAVGTRTVIADRPEILYYLGATRSIYDQPGPQKVHDPTTRGIFGFVQGWSESYGMHLDDFKGLIPFAHLTPGIYLFERP